MSSNENNPYTHFENREIRQGDILVGVKFQYISQNQAGDAELSLGFPFPYAVVLSQACDLEQHYQNLKAKAQPTEDSVKPRNDDKILDTVLVCPAFASEKFLTGTHIDERQMFDFGGPKGKEKALKKLKKNDEFNRYHNLEPLKETFPELIIDFKKFHTVPIDILEEYYDYSYLASLRGLYRERLSQRFSNYLSRIGLPGDSQNT
jgi:hypothetical protein